MERKASEIEKGAEWCSWSCIEMKSRLIAKLRSSAEDWCGMLRFRRIERGRERKRIILEWLQFGLTCSSNCRLPRICRYRDTHTHTCHMQFYNLLYLALIVIFLNKFIPVFFWYQQKIAAWRYLLSALIHVERGDRRSIFGSRKNYYCWYCIFEIIRNSHNNSVGDIFAYIFELVYRKCVSYGTRDSPNIDVIVRTHYTIKRVVAK